MEEDFFSSVCLSLRLCGWVHVALFELNELCPLFVSLPTQIADYEIQIQHLTSEKARCMQEVSCSVVNFYFIGL